MSYVEVSSEELYNYLSVQPPPSDKFPPVMVLDARTNPNPSGGTVSKAIQLCLPTPLPFSRGPFRSSKEVKNAEDQLEALIASEDDRRVFRFRKIFHLVVIAEDPQTHELPPLLLELGRVLRLEVMTAVELERFMTECPFYCKDLSAQPLPFQAYPSRVLPHLYLGNMDNAASWEQLRTLGITAVLNCAKEIANFFEHKHGEVLTYRKFFLEDSNDEHIARHFDEAFSFIEEVRLSGGKVLVHCQAGRNRSGIISAAYLVRLRKVDWKAAIAEVKSARMIAIPGNNIGFEVQLKVYSEEIMSSSSTP